MRRLVITRLMQSLPVLFLVACANFILTRAAPGDAASAMATVETTPEGLAEIRRNLGLDQPLLTQLAKWLGRLVRGDMGTSYLNGAPVMDSIQDRAWPTIQLALLTMMLILAVGIPLGVMAALHRDGALDKFVRGFSVGASAVPGFLLGVLFIVVFGWWFPGIVPFQGYVSILDDPFEGLRRTILPAVSLALGPIGVVCRLTRSSMVDVMQQDYVLAARAFGVSPREIVWRDGLKNSLLPVLTSFGVTVGYLLSGTVVIERIFGIPGLGRLLIDAFGQRDYPIAVGVTVVISIVYVMVNLGTDILYGLFNPRIRAGYAAGTA
jgi:peptide/nickel transport system permease protein